MGYIRNTKKVDNREKNNVKVTTPFGRRILAKVNAMPQKKTAFEKFVDAMRAEKNDIYVYRDDDNEFMAYTRFGAVYSYYMGNYAVIQYPTPSAIKRDAIIRLIEEEEGANDWDNVAEMAHFLYLSAEEKDKEGFAFYNWIWEDGVLDDEYFYESLGEDEILGEKEEENPNQLDLTALAHLKAMMEKD